jgi:hypothetical protein
VGKISVTGGGFFGGEADLVVMKISVAAGLLRWRARARGDKDLGREGGCFGGEVELAVERFQWEQSLPLERRWQMTRSTGQRCSWWWRIAG